MINAYLRVIAGLPCTELDRSESERLLRAQKFIASATVRPVPDGPGKVRIVVETVDEIPVIIGGSFAGVKYESGLVGTENLDGLGLTLELSEAQGFGATGPATAATRSSTERSASRSRSRSASGSWGDALQFEFSKPFLTDCSQTDLRIGANEQNSYYDLTRLTGDDVFSECAARAGTLPLARGLDGSPKSGAIGAIIGGVIIGVTNTASQAVFATDTLGLRHNGLPEVDNRYGDFGVADAGVFAGIRAIHFQTEEFDAVTAAAGCRGAVRRVRGAEHLGVASTAATTSLSCDLYAGMVRQSFVEMRARGVGRADRPAQRGDGMVGYAKTVWYVKPSDDVTRIATLELSGVQHLTFPLQLSFWDHEGGLPGFPDALTVGGQRAIFRLEERHVVSMFPIFGKRADWAVAFFADAGKIWAGDVPFGETSPVRGPSASLCPAPYRRAASAPTASTSRCR